MKKILHISDIHASIHPTKGQVRQKVEMLTTALLEDVEAISDVDTVVVSGDITFSGQREEFGLFISEIIEPLKEKMGLENDDFLFAPGNHDTDRSGFSYSVKKSIESLRENYNQEEIKFLQDEFVANSGSPISNWLEFAGMFYKSSENILALEKFYQCFRHGSVGVACLNTGWSAIGENDRERLFVGVDQIEAAFKLLRGFSEKVLVMHHPLDWLHPEERKLLSERITSSKISTIFYGHMHEFNVLREASFSEDFVLKMQAGRFDLSGSETNGYSVVSTLHSGNLSSGTICFRKFDDVKKKFVPWVERCRGGAMDYEAAPAGGFNREAFANDCKEVLEQFDYDLLCNIGAAESERKRLSDVFVCPAIKLESYELEEEGEEKYMAFEELANSRDSFLIVGGENSGKSTILKNLLMHKLKDQSRTELDEIAFYVDCKGKKLSSKNRIKSMLAEVYEKLPGASLYFESLARKIVTENALLIFDGVDGLSQGCIDELVGFLSDHQTPRFIISCKHATARELSTRLKTQAARNFSELNIGGMKRSHLKGLIGKWLTSASDKQKVAKEVQRIVGSAGMPNNLFVYSMLLSIYERKQGHFSNYLHEADLVENFIEVLMQKHCVKNERAPQYKDLLRLLGSVADKMVERNSFSLNRSVLDKIVVEFNGNIAQDFSVESYVNPILHSGVLEYSESRYRFSQVCFFDYVYARYLSNKRFEYSDLHRKMDFLRFHKVVEYMSAISKEDAKLLTFCEALTSSAWSACVASEKLSNLRAAAEELQDAAQSDILDEIKESSIDDTINDEVPKEDEIDEHLDSVNPLRESARNGEERAEWDDLHDVTLFHSALSLYARVFRAAEHVTDRGVADRHFSSSLDFYQKTIALNTRRFQEKLRPLVIDKLAEHSKFQELRADQKKQAKEKFDAFLNFVVASFPNFAVAMMSADLVNARQVHRLRERRAKSDDPLEKMLITYALCEVDGTNTLEEIQSLSPEKSYKYSSLIMKIIELSHMDFTLTVETRKALLKHARSLLKNKVARRLVDNMTDISTKISGDLLSEGGGR